MLSTEAKQEAVLGAREKLVRSQIVSVSEFIGESVPPQVNFIGNCDIFEPERMSGWVLALGDPMDPVIVSICLGDYPIATCETEFARPDVQKVLGRTGLRKYRLRPGFEARPHSPALLHALARLCAEGESGTVTVPLTAVLMRPTARVTLPSVTVLEKTPNEWLEYFGLSASPLTEAPAQPPPLAVPGFAGATCAGIDDCLEAVPPELCEAVLRSPFFDRDHYLARAVETALPLARSLERWGDMALAAHFCCVGAPRAIVPSARLKFDPVFYRASHGDARPYPPLLDFIDGWDKGTPRFPNADAARAARFVETEDLPTGKDDLAACAPRFWAASAGFDEGFREQIDRSLVQRLRLVSRAAELAGHDIDSILQLERRRQDASDIESAMADIARSGLFDAEFYRGLYDDVRSSAIDPVYHYVAFGEREGRMPSPDFDPRFYLRTNRDVRTQVPNALAHFAAHGRGEGRMAMSPRKAGDRPEFGKPVLFVGHSALRAGAERVLLELVRWTYQHTCRPMTVFLLSDGPLVAEFSRYAQVITTPSDPALDLAIRQKLAEQEWQFVYLNTVVAGRFLSNLHASVIGKMNLVAHIHEMERVLAEHEDDLRPILRHAAHYVSASPATTDVLSGKYAVPQARISDIAAFIRPISETESDVASNRQQARAALGVSPDQRVIMGCGSLYWRKGGDIFVDTAIQHLARARTSDVFVWVGGGADQEELTQRIVGHGLGDRIRLIGERDNAAFLLAAADLFFLSSREDPFPLVCLEAAQHEVPTLFFEGTSGIGAFVGSDAGYTTDRTDPAEVSAVIDAIFANEPDRLRRGKIARDRLMTTYTSPRQCRRIFHTLQQVFDIAPLVSIIVPNYNHADYLGERLESIFDQSMLDFELIVLDDCSSDASVDLIETRIADHPNAWLVKNKTNSGHVFRQWQRGLAHARGTFVWVAESDDACAPDFLNLLLRRMSEPGVAIAAGRTVPFTADGTHSEAMQAYLATQCPGLFEADFTLDGDRFVNLGMGAACLLVNASGLLFRSAVLKAHVDKGLDYAMCGDWAIYLHMLRHGKVAYAAAAENFFRRHPTSRVHTVEGSEVYFDERRRIAELVYGLFPVGASLHGRIRSTLRHEVERFRHRSPDIRHEHVVPAMARPTLQRRKRVAFYVHGMLFSHGGIERLAAQLTSHLAAHGYEVHLLCRHWGSGLPVFPLHDDVIVKPIFSEDRIDGSVDDLHRYLVANGVELFVPMLSEWLFAPVVEAAVRAGVPVIASEHNDPWKIEELWWSREDRHAVLSRTDRIHLLSESFVASLPEALHERVTIIPNGVDTDAFRPGDAPRERLILAAGRLAPQKRMDLLIEAFARSGLSADGWRLEIYGAGEDRDALARQIGQLELAHAARLCGTSENMPEIYSRASFTVLASDFEGFGIVVLESLASGTPVIAFDDCSGPNEIIIDGKTGRLAVGSDDRAGNLAATMSDMARSRKRLARMSRASRARAQEYSLDAFFRKWTDCIETVGENLPIGAGE